MKGVDITNRLKEVLPLYADDFSDILAISSLSRSGTTITGVTSAAHGLLNNSYITIRGAKEPVAITSINRVDTIVTVVTTTDHKLSNPALYSEEEAAKLTVEIAGAVPAEYNGTFKLLTVPDSTTFTYLISDTPTSPATTPGFLLLSDFDAYNGYKQITVVNATTFTYTTTNSSLGTPAQGTTELSNASRIAYSATPQRADQHYSEDTDRVNQKWLYVVAQSAVVYKDGTTASDIDSAMDSNEKYFYEEQQEFSLYIFLPSQNETLAGVVSDLARDLKKPILKSIANYQFLSPLNEGCYQPTSYIGNETDDYNTAYYVHRYDFSAKLYVKEQDVAEVGPGVPLQTIDGSTQGIDLTYKPELR